MDSLNYSTISLVELEGQKDFATQYNIAINDPQKYPQQHFVSNIILHTMSCIGTIHSKGGCGNHDAKKAAFDETFRKKLYKEFGLE